MKIYASAKSGEDFLSAFFLTIFLFRTVIGQHIYRAFFHQDAPARLANKTTNVIQFTLSVQVYILAVTLNFSAAPGQCCLSPALRAADCF
ncbi:hypothetical protein ACVRUF_001822 [Cronobacter turicensis]|nr:hypothetical protein [Cronobacter turicensis]ELY4350090.1 hypothetical protein [Cronobacter turicensis]ELY6279226.1 hypothetical protein [Cronobacter turicensis]